MTLPQTLLVFAAALTLGAVAGLIIRRFQKEDE